VRPVGRGEQDIDVIEDAYCQGPKPKETELCEASRRKRGDGSDSKRQHMPAVSARLGTLTRQNDFIKVIGPTNKTALSGNHDIARDRRPSCRLSRASDLSHSTNIDNVNTLPSARANLISPDDSARDSNEIHHSDRLRTDKKSHDESDNQPIRRQVKRIDKIKKDELVIDKEDTRNLTLTIILERDEKNVIVNFPKDFEPRPPENDTSFTLVGIDALRYIQRIQEEARGMSFSHKRRAR